MRYRVFRLNEDNRLEFDGESTALGDGSRDITYIILSHNLRTGDVIYINDTFLLLRGVQVWTYLDLNDSTTLVGGEPWGPEVAKKLYAMAIA